MQDIFDMAKKLGQSIGESDINAEYKEALARIKADPKTLAKITEFKRIQLDYEALDLSREKHLSKLYFDLCMNPEAKRFLACEKALLTMMLGVQEQLWVDCAISLEVLG